MPGTSALGKRTPAKRPDDARYAPVARSPFLAASYNPPGKYLPGSGIYNLTGANWKHARNALAKARAGAGLCRVAVIGDSIAAGYHATTINTDAWPNVLREYMAKLGYTAAGTGDVMTGSLGVWGASSPDNRWTGGWSLVTSANNGGGYGALTTTSGPVQTFTTDKAGTVVDFTYATEPAWGSFTVTVKNSSGTVLTGPTAYSSNAAIGITRVTLTGLTLDVGSTVVFTSTTTAINCVFSCGVRNTSGVLISNYGIGSASSSTFNQFAAPGSGFNSGYILKQLLTAGVDIVLLALGANDAFSASSGVTPAAFATNLASIVSNLKPATADLALIHPTPTLQTSVDYWSATSPSGYNSSTFYAQADALGCPLLDESDRWQDYATANASGLMFDAIHPNSAGYQRLGLDVANLLTA